MKKLIILFLAVILSSCNSQKKYSDFDYSYTRSGGFAPIYENFLIKGNKAHYSFEGQGKNIKKDFKISNEEIKKLEEVLTANNFRMIEEDHKKLYDYIGTRIKVSNGPNAASKSDASYIMPKHQQKWDNVAKAFRELLDSKINTTK